MSWVGCRSVAATASSDTLLTSHDLSRFATRIPRFPFDVHPPLIEVPCSSRMPLPGCIMEQTSTAERMRCPVLNRIKRRFANRGGQEGLCPVFAFGEKGTTDYRAGWDRLHRPVESLLPSTLHAWVVSVVLRCCWCCMKCVAL